ncbi:hypothetical protein BsWGS_18770 [Bradybaena similaris]
MASSEIELVYFDGKGRAEAGRLVLVAAGKQFKDTRFSEKDWPKYKPQAPFGQAPFLIVDGVTYGQSLAIKNFLAREFGFYGQSNTESLLIDQLMNLLEDFTNVCVPIVEIEDEEKQKKEIARVKADVSPRYLGYLERLLKENGTGYFAGNRLTLADIAAFDLVTGMLENYVDVDKDKYPLLHKNVAIVNSHDKIGPYIKSRPITPY